MQAGGDSGTVNVENLGARRDGGMTHIQVRNLGCNVRQGIGYAHEISVSVPNDILPLDRCVGLVVVDGAIITTSRRECFGRQAMVGDG